MPIYHWKPERIEVHFALILWEMTVLKGGHISVGNYIYPGERSFHVQITLDIKKVLSDIFKSLRIKWEYFDIDVPTTGGHEAGSGKTMEG